MAESNMSAPESSWTLLVPIPQRLVDNAWVVLLVVVAHLLIAGIEEALDRLNCPFPAAILAMIVVFGVLLVAERVWAELETFYQGHLQTPADLLNRHMSIGFTVPIVMLCRGPPISQTTIGLIIACFMSMILINITAAYILAYPIQVALIHCTQHSGPPNLTEEEHTTDQTPSSNEMNQLWRSERALKFVSGTSSIVSSMFRASAACSVEIVAPSRHCTDQPPAETTGLDTDTDMASERQGWAVRSLRWASERPMLVVWWCTALVVGIPLKVTGTSEPAFATFLLFAIWLTTLTVQSEVKNNPALPKPLRTLLGGLSNPVLWTSLAMLAYVYAEQALRSQPLRVILDEFHTNKTFAAIIRHRSSLSPVDVTNTENIITVPDTPLLGAGDIAMAILNAGLVSWGLKLYEYKRQLLSRGGLTVFLVSSIMALGNVLCGPLLARAVDLELPSRELAFAARSVTITLGAPAVTQLGGDLSLNAALVVAGGILFQMGLGFGVGELLEQKAQQVVGSLVSMRTVAFTLLTRAHDTGRRARNTNRTASLEEQEFSLTLNDPQVVAAGVTVGINAAAMGTAHLYEVQSAAAAFSALSMTAFGIMTVVFCTIHPIAQWVIAQVQRT